jgi:hypothetical protein
MDQILPRPERGPGWIPCSAPPHPDVSPHRTHKVRWRLDRLPAGSDRLSPTARNERKIAGAILACWSLVHGLTLLLADGLVGPKKEAGALSESLVQGMLDGLAAELREQRAVGSIPRSCKGSAAQGTSRSPSLICLLNLVIPMAIAVSPYCSTPMTAANTGTGCAKPFKARASSSTRRTLELTASAATRSIRI